MKADDLKFLMSTTNGRAVIWSLLSFCGVYDQVQGSFEEMLLLEGKRRIGLQLMGNLAEHCEDQYFMMMKEAKSKSKEKEDEQKRDSDQKGRDYSRGEDFDFGRHFGLDEIESDDSGPGLFI